MDRRIYFKDLDKRLAELALARDQDRSVQDANLRFVERAVAQVVPIAVRYMDDLNARDIEATLSGNADGLTFQLVYRDGTERALTMYPNPETHHIAFVDHTPGDKRRHASSGDAVSYDPQTWSPDVFEKRLQRFIDEFLEASNWHGGVRSRS